MTTAPNNKPHPSTIIYIRNLQAVWCIHITVIYLDNKHLKFQQATGKSDNIKVNSRRTRELTLKGRTSNSSIETGATE
jgi:hypothetical protein